MITCLLPTLLLFTLLRAAPFDRIGEFPLVTTSGECESLAGYDVSPLGNEALYFGRLKGENRSIGVWLNARFAFSCDSVLDYGYTRAAKPYVLFVNRGLCQVYFHGEASPRNQEIVYDPATSALLNFSPDGNHLAFLVRDEQSLRAARDMNPEGQFASINSLSWTPNGQDLYYLAARDSSWFLVSDGRTGRACDSASNLVIAPRTSQPIFIDYERNGQMLVNGGHEGRRWDRIAELTFTPGDSTPAYIAHDSRGWHIVEDTIVRFTQKAVLLQNLHYRSGARTPVYVAVDSTFRFRLYDAGHPLSEDQALIEGVTVSPDGSRIAWFAVDSTHRRLYINRDEIRLPGRPVSPVVFSPDSRHWALTVALPGDSTQPAAYAVVLDTTKGRTYGGIDAMQFLPRTSDLFYMARTDSGCFPVQNGQEGSRYDGVGTPVLTPSGDVIAYLATRGEKACQVINGLEGKFYDDVGPIHFSPDGSRAGYGARQGKVFLWVVSAVPVPGK
jgi:WD40 repeat protein